MSRAFWLAASCALSAHALASPRSDPTIGRAVFTGATSPDPTSIELNPSALGLGIPYQVYAAALATMDNYSIDRKKLDLDTGALTDGDHLGITQASPGWMAAGVWHAGEEGRITLALAYRSSPAEQFIANQQALRYYTLGGEHRVHSLTIGGSIKIENWIYGGLSLSAQPSVLSLRYARDTALEAARDPNRGIASDCGGSPCGVENPQASETYQVDVKSDLLSTANFALNVGGTVELARGVWFGTGFHLPPGLARQNELDGTLKVERAPRDGGGTVDGGATVYISQPASWDFELRAGLPDQLDLHVGARWEWARRFQQYDVRTYGSFFPSEGIPEWMPRTRGLNNTLAMWAGVEQSEIGTLEPAPVRLGGRIGFETAAVDNDKTTPLTIAPTSFTADVGIQLRLSQFVLQLTYGLQYFPAVNVTDSAFDPRGRLLCADSGYDYSTSACEAVRNGYALPTAAGEYQRFEHAVRFALRYDFPP